MTRLSSCSHTTARRSGGSSLMDPRVSFRWDVPKQFNFARDVFDTHEGDALALHFVSSENVHRAYAYEEISETSQQYARVFLDAGIGRGSRVLVCLPKIPEWLFVLLALDRLGAVAI